MRSADRTRYVQHDIFLAVLLPGDEEFQKQYARAFILRNELCAEELLENRRRLPQRLRDRVFGDTMVEVRNPELIARSKVRIETRKWLMEFPAQEVGRPG